MDNDKNNGEKIRRSVLGDEHVEQSNQNISDFNAPFVEFITQFPFSFFSFSSLLLHSGFAVTLRVSQVKALLIFFKLLSKGEVIE